MPVRALRQIGYSSNSAHTKSVRILLMPVRALRPRVYLDGVLETAEVRILLMPVRALRHERLRGQRRLASLSESY